MGKTVSKTFLCHTGLNWLVINTHFYSFNFPLSHIYLALQILSVKISHCNYITKLCGLKDLVESSLLWLCAEVYYHQKVFDLNKTYCKKSSMLFYEREYFLMQTIALLKILSASDCVQKQPDRLLSNLQKTPIKAPSEVFLPSGLPKIIEEVPLECFCH